MATDERKLGKAEALADLAKRLPPLLVHTHDLETEVRAALLTVKSIRLGQALKLAARDAAADALGLAPESPLTGIETEPPAETPDALEGASETPPRPNNGQAREEGPAPS